MSSECQERSKNVERLETDVVADSAWNQKHLANPNKRTHMMVICARLTLPAPQIVTPDLLMVEDNNG